MVKTSILGTLLFLLCFSISLVLLAPVKWIWTQFVEDTLPLKQHRVEVQALTGTLFNGAGKFKVQGVQAIVDWQLGWPSLSMLGLPLNARLQTIGGELPLELNMGLGQYQMRIPSARLDTAQINPLLRQQRVSLSGDVSVSGLSFQWTNSTGLEGTGEFSWAGGPIKYPAGRQVKNGELPAFQGEIVTESGVTKVSIRDQGETYPSIIGQIDQEGVGVLEVKRRILDLVDEPWPSNSRPTDTVFKVKRQILPAIE